MSAAASTRCTLATIVAFGCLVGSHSLTCAATPSTEGPCRECQGVPHDGCPQQCACPFRPAPGEKVKATCADAIDACKGVLPKVQGLYLLEENSVYRTSDILRHHGFRWRSDSLAIMCNPKFRNTFLRDVLRETTQVNGQGTAHLNDADLENAMQSQSDGPERFACAMGVTGPGGVHLGNTWKLVDTMARYIAERYHNGTFQTALGHELVVNVRLGDYTHPWSKTVAAVKQAATQAGGISRIIFSGVIHYGGYDTFVSSNSSIAHSVNLMHELVRHFENGNYTTALRSEPSADRDLEYMATAPNLAIGGLGFAQLVTLIRAKVFALVKSMKSMKSTCKESTMTRTPRTWTDASFDGEPVVR